MTDEEIDTLEWFQHQGQKAQRHMAAALRIYTEAHKSSIAHQTRL